MAYLEDTYTIQQKKYTWYVDGKTGEKIVIKKESNSENEDDSENV